VTISFRPLQQEVFPLPTPRLGIPHVAAWWREPADLPSLEARHGPAIDGDETTEPSIVEQDGVPTGLISRYLIVDEPVWARTPAVAGIPAAPAGMDYLIGEPSLTRLGLGPKVIDKFVADSRRRYPHLAAIVDA
jgi:hypothetical protein